MFMSEFSFLAKIYRRKMKLIFFLLVLFGNGLKSTEGELIVLHSSRGLILRTYFNIYFKDSVKVCCKFKHGKCATFVNSREEMAVEYKGRILTEKNNLFFDVIFIKPNITDIGKYICGFGFKYIFAYEVDVTNYDLQRTLKVRSSTSPSVLLESEKHTQEHSGGDNMVLTLAVVCSVVAVAVIISVTLLVFLLKRWKKKSRDKSGNCGSHDKTEQNLQEQNSMIYSTMVFKSHEDQVELYANLQIHRPRHTDLSSTDVIQTRECEYSTILTAHP